MSLRRFLALSPPSTGEDESPLRFRRLAVALGLVVLVFVLSRLDEIWTNSIDLPHHYALAFRIFELWAPPGQDSSLNVMAFYPWLAHAAAAVLGSLVGSVFMGVQLVALLSFAGVWVAIIGLVCTTPRQQTLWTCAALTVLVSYWRQRGVEFHGSEVIRNFFLSQLTAQALVFAALWSAVLVERRMGWASAAGVLALWVQLIAFVHLLPALMLMGVAVLSVVLGLARQAWQGRASPGTLALAAVLIVLVCGAMVLHPSFVASAKIASNDGDLTFSILSYPDGVRWLCAAAAVTACAQIWIGAVWRPSQHAIRYLGLYGTTVVGLCVLQMVALAFGHGSPYAVKKYVFALNTHLVLSAAMAQGWTLEKALRGTRARIHIGHGFGTALVCATFAALVLTVVPYKPTLRASQIARAERQVLAAHALQESAAVPGQPDLVLDLAGLPPTIPYMFSVAILHTPMDLALDEIMGSRGADWRGEYARVLATTPADGILPGCPWSTHGPITSYAASCLTVPTAPCRGTFDFQRRLELKGAPVQGFSRPEVGGRWTIGPIASFSCMVEDPAALQELVLLVVPFLGGELANQRLRVTVGSTGPQEFTLKRQALINLPLKSVAQGRLDVALEMPDAASPRSLGVNTDERALGFRIVRAEFR